MTTPEDLKLSAVTKRLRRETLRAEELDRQRQLLENLPVLGSEDAIRVLKADTAALVLIDADTATVKVPAFQFVDETDQIKRDEVTGALVMNPGVLAVFRQQSPGFDRPSRLSSASAWHMLYWWTTEMRLDVSDPRSQPFHPIDVVHDSRTLDELVNWLKDMSDESYG